MDGAAGYPYSYNLSMVMEVTNPLGVPWHPIEVKGQEFKSMVPYIGFIWDLKHHCISLTPKKHLKYLLKVCSSLHVTNSLFSQKDCMSILGTLQCLSFVYKEGCSTLPPFLAFLAKFPNKFLHHHAPKSVIENLHW